MTKYERKHQYSKLGENFFVELSFWTKSIDGSAASHAFEQNEKNSEATIKINLSALLQYKTKWDLFERMLYKEG